MVTTFAVRFDLLNGNTGYGGRRIINRSSPTWRGVLLEAKKGICDYARMRSPDAERAAWTEFLEGINEAFNSKETSLRLRKPGQLQYWMELSDLRVLVTATVR